MKGEDALFQLVKSLSVKEKREFEVAAQKDSNYFELYKYLLKQKEYDEEKIKKHFKGRGFIRQLAVAKRYLIDAIVDALIEEKHISKLLAQYKFLCDKRLLPQAVRKLQEAEEEARRHEELNYLLEIFDLRYKNNRALTKGVDDYSFDDYYKQRSEVLVQQDNLLQFTHLSETLYYRYRKEGLIRSDKQKAELDKIMATPLLKDEDQALTIKAKAVYYRANVLYQHMIREHEKALEMSVKNIEFTRKHPLIFPKDSPVYVTQLYAHTLLAETCGNFEEFKRSFSEFRKLKLTDPERKADQFNSVYNLSVIYHYDTRKFKEGIAFFEKEVAPKISRFERLIEPYKLMVNYNMTAKMFLYADDGINALKWNNKALEITPVRHRVEMHSIARLTDVLIHYHLGNLSLVRYKLKNLGRFLKNKNSLYDLEKITIDMVRKLLSTKNQQEEKEVLEEYLEKSKQLDDLTQGYLNVAYWIEMRMQSK